MYLVYLKNNLLNLVLCNCLLLLKLCFLKSSMDTYLQGRPRDTVALLGDRVLLDCITNVSRSLVWHLRRHGSQSDVWISSGNEIASNISDSFKILSNEVGQFVLVIDPVLMSLAGRYECDDRDQVVPSFAHVALLSKDIFETVLEQFVVDVDVDDRDDGDDDVDSAR